MFKEHQESDETSEQRPLSMVLLGGLYLFFFLLTVSTYGSPFPFMGAIYQGRVAELIVFIDSLVTLYLFMGLMKRQRMTWSLLLVYNSFEIVNTIINLIYIAPKEVESLAGKPVEPEALLMNNVAVIVAVILLSVFIYRQREHFTNQSRYIF